MTTAKHQREEDLIEVVEPPRKKSKKDKSTSDPSKPKKYKEKKAKPEKCSDVEAIDTPVEEVKKGKTDKKEKKKVKKIKEKVADDNIIDAASVEEPAAVATPESAPEEPQPEFKISKNGKKSKKDKKKEKKAKKSGENVADEDLADTPAEDPNPEAEPDTEEPTKKSKKDKKEKKSKKEKTRSELNGMSNGTSATGYEETSALKSLLESEITSFLTKHDIVISNPEPFPSLRPIISFSHLPLTDLLSKSPFASFTTPTPIQAASWPYGLSGRDIIGIAETGSGKTMAFALPCVEAVIAGARTGPGTRKTTRAVIVSPTRELAMQTHEQVSKLCGLVGLNCVCIYGGASKDDQRRELKKGAAVVVATPGRLKDFLNDGDINLSSAAFAVLDEADRMLDKGFEDDIKLILSSCPPRERRQTLMFTATWPTSVQALASTFMVSPVKITIGKGAASDDDEVKLQANARIKQEVEVVDPRGKERRALEIIKQQGRNERILVFCLYKKEAVRVEAFFQQRGVRVCSIHGDLRQDQRTRALEEFKSGKTPVLVATDVAARGLDIPEVKLVLNVTFPLTIEDYVHRIGRTGRAGKDGHAITLFTEHDKAHSGSLINVLKAANQPVPDELLKFGTTVKKKGHDGYGAFFKNVDMNKKATKITFD